MTQKIEECMTRDPVTIDASRTVADAARIMREKDIGDVLVARDGKLTGILTDRDIVVRCVATGEPADQTPVEKVCSPELSILAPDEDVETAVKLMAKKAIRRVPVVDGDKPVGILSIGDLAQNRDERSALAGISGAQPNR